MDQFQAFMREIAGDGHDADGHQERPEYDDIVGNCVKEFVYTVHLRLRLLRLLGAPEMFHAPVETFRAPRRV